MNRFATLTTMPSEAPKNNPNNDAKNTATHPAPALPLDLVAKRVHFIGIGGCGMSGLARITRGTGAVCTGSDTTATAVTDSLQSEGFPVTLEQTADTLPADCELVVASAAVCSTHPEVAEATRRGIPTLKYAQMLGQLMVGRTGVAIAGTHGKSTTTSMLCHTLIQAGLDPSWIIGASCPQIGGGARQGRDNHLIVEACEFDRSFHHLNPTHAVILNVEEDHMDIYGSIDAIAEAFAVFAAKIPPGGSLLIQHETPHRLAVTAKLTCQIETLGFAPGADWRVNLIDAPASPPSDSPGAAVHQPIELLHNDAVVCRWTSAMPGDHMAYNAAAAAVTAHRLGATWDDIARALSTFQGLDRRMQLLGTRPVTGTRGHPGHVTVIDDYGHHPTEIDTTLRALRRAFQPRRLICVFQPHQHSRTRFLMEQFAAGFRDADIVIVPDIYFVRDSEQERHAVRAADLVDRLRTQGRQAMHLHPFAAIVEQLALITQPGDLLVTMGAGDVWQIARDFLESGASGDGDKSACQ